MGGVGAGLRAGVDGKVAGYGQAVGLGLGLGLGSPVAVGGMEAAGFGVEASVQLEAGQGRRWPRRWL